MPINSCYFNLESKNSVENFEQILKNDPSTLSVSRSGRVKCNQTKTFLGRLFTPYQAQRERDLSKAIFSILEELSTPKSLDKSGFFCAIPCESDQSSEKVNQAAIERLVTIFNQLKHKDENVLRRLQTKETAKAIENLLSPELKAYREAKKSDPNLYKNNPEKRWEISRNKFLVAEKFGLGRAANSGTTGSFIAKSLRGKSVGIVKGSNALVSVGTRVKQAVKKSIGEQLAYLKQGEFAQAHTEVAAHLLDKQLGWKMTPISRCIDLENKEAIFQSFIKDGYQMASDVLAGEYGKKTEFTQREIALFQKMALYDFLLGNLDRHHENWFVKVENNEIVGIYAIDNANSLTNKTPGIWNMWLLRSYYKWAELDLAKQNFLPESVQLIRDLIKDHKIEAWKAELNQELPGFLEPEMEKGIEKRLAVLAHMVNKAHTPAELALFKTEEALNGFMAGPDKKALSASLISC